MTMYICRNCKKEFEKSESKTPEGSVPFYCTNDCYEESYAKLEVIWQKNNHNEEKAWAEFEKTVWGKQESYTVKHEKSIEFKDGKKIEYR